MPSSVQQEYRSVAWGSAWLVPPWINTTAHAEVLEVDHDHESYESRHVGVGGGCGDVFCRGRLPGKRGKTLLCVLVPCGKKVCCPSKGWWAGEVLKAYPVKWPGADWHLAVQRRLSATPAAVLVILSHGQPSAKMTRKQLHRMRSLTANLTTGIVLAG